MSIVTEEQHLQTVLRRRRRLAMLRRSVSKRVSSGGIDWMADGDFAVGYPDGLRRIGQDWRVIGDYPA